MYITLVLLQKCTVSKEIESLTPWISFSKKIRFILSRYKDFNHNQISYYFLFGL